MKTTIEYKETIVKIEAEQYARLLNAEVDIKTVKIETSAGTELIIPFDKSYEYRVGDIIEVHGILLKQDFGEKV